MALLGQRIRHPRGGEGAHDLARLQRGFEIDLRTVRNAAECRIQFARRGEHRVAQFLGGEPARLEDGVARPGRIFFREHLAVWMRRAAAIRLARHDQRCSSLNDQPFSTNVAASQSSSSGCVGFLPVLPKLFGLPAIGWSKCQSQMRFTMARVVSGLSALATQSANAFRRPSIEPGTGNAGRGVIAVEHAERAGFHLRALREWIAAGEDVASPRVRPSVMRFCGHPHRRSDATSRPACGRHRRRARTARSAPAPT